MVPASHVARSSQLAGLAFGSGWFRRCHPRWAVATSILGIVITAVVAAVRTPTWPDRDDPALEPSGSPAVSRVGDGLEFHGPVPWTGRRKHDGMAITFGGPPASQPGFGGIRYESRGIVTEHHGMLVVTSPADAELRIRAGLAVFISVVATLFGMLMWFVERLLVRIRTRKPLRGHPIAPFFRAVAAAACGAAIAAIATPAAIVTLAVAPIAVFGALLGANVLVESFLPAPPQSTSGSGPAFEV